MIAQMPQENSATKVHRSHRGINGFLPNESNEKLSFDAS
jgi:hypothetical protein